MKKIFFITGCQDLFEESLTLKPFELIVFTKKLTVISQ
jgi:hypothetical protein